jgi:putative DNA primase/helicase
MSADQIGIGLKGRRNGNGWLVRCPCPSHGKGRGDHSPSLSVTDADDGRLLLRCFAGCEFIAILDALKRLGLVDDSPKFDRARLALSRVDPAPPTHEPDAAALQIWRTARPAGGTVVAEYLERRGVSIAPPSLRCGSVMHLRQYEMPTMVAAVQRPDGKVVAVQTTILTLKGTKAPVSIPKITTGALGAGAVRFAPAAKTMGIAEGVETALSAQIMAGIPVWASLGCHRLHRIELPRIVREIHIFADNDDPGRAAASRTAALHQQIGHKVVLRFPPETCKDWNDFQVLKQRTAEHAA